MTLVAQLYTDGRGAERVAAGRDATLRDSAQRPIDIVIEDLSSSGFGMSTAEDLAVGSILNLRLAGISKRDVRVVRRFGLTYGCEFAPPLTERELALVLSAGLVIDASFAVSDDGARFAVSGVPGSSAKLSPPMRAGVLFGSIAALWLVIILAVDLLVGR